MKDFLQNPIVRHPLVITLITVLLGGVGSLIGHYLFRPSNVANVSNTTSVNNVSGVVQTATGNSAPVYQAATVNQYPPAKLSYQILSPSQKQSDGLYHTTFGIYVYYAQGTDKPNIIISKLINCPPINDTNTSLSLAPNGERTGLSCTSANPIFDNKGGLFKL